MALEELQDLKGVWSELSKIWEQIDQMKEQPWVSVQPRKVCAFEGVACMPSHRQSETLLGSLASRDLYGELTKCHFVVIYRIPPDSWKSSFKARFKQCSVERNVGILNTVLCFPWQLRQNLDGLLNQLKNFPARLRQYASYEFVQRLLKGYLKVGKRPTAVGSVRSAPAW